MPLPNSGTISLSQIISEFSGPNNLNSYRRGQGYVKSHSQNASITSASSGGGSISGQQFYGALKNFQCSMSIGTDFSSIYGYLSGSYGSASPTGIGTSASSTNQTTFYGWYDVYGDVGFGPTYFSTQFIVSGNQTGTWWSTISWSSITLSRPDSGSYSGGYTTWTWLSGPYFGSSGSSTFTII